MRRIVFAVISWWWWGGAKIVSALIHSHTQTIRCLINTADVAVTAESQIKILTQTLVSNRLFPHDLMTQAHEGSLDQESSTVFRLGPPH